MTPTPRAIRICGSGHAVPSRCVTSDELDDRLKLPAGTVARRSGISRRFHSIEETAAELAVIACERALDDAGLDWDDVDCLVAASATMDQALPFNAALVLARARPRTPMAAFDVGASCLSFIAALDTLSYAVADGRYRSVLIVSADIATFALDWSSLDHSTIFGDGAAAVVIRRSDGDETSTIIGAKMTTYAEGAELCRISAGGSRFHPRRALGTFDDRTLFQMDGARLFRFVAKRLSAFIDAFTNEVDLSLGAFDIVVPHQASRLAIDHVSRRLGLDPARVVDIFAEYGNQVAASLPTAFHLAVGSGAIQRGQLILLLGTGAGVTIGALALRY